MNPGELREIVRILRPSQVQDETGQKADGWETVADNVRARIRAQPGGESTAAGPQVIARIPTTFEIRWPHTYEIDSTMRIVHRTKLFQVLTAVDETKLRAKLVINCEELVGEPPWLAST